MYSAPSGQKRLDFYHMYNFQDIRGSNKKSVYPSNTIMDYISFHPQMKRFTNIIKKANMDVILSNPQANFTIFIPLDPFIPTEDKFYENMDIGTCKTIVNSNLLNNKIEKKILKSSPISYYYTLNNKNRLCIMNQCDKTIINDCAQVLYYDIILDNGVIHMVNNLIIPNNNTFIN